MQIKIVKAGTKQPSFARAAETLTDQADLQVDAKEVERLTEKIGAERCAERDNAVSTYVSLPLTERKKNPAGVISPPDEQVVVVGVDGGRYQEFDFPRPAKAKSAAGASSPEPGVAGVDEAKPEPDANHRGTHWREDKIALMMKMKSREFEADPCPHLPEVFADPTRIAKLARELKTKRSANVGGEEQAKPSANPEEDLQAVHSGSSERWQPPEVLEKHFAATQRPWSEFGPMVATKAWSLGFFEAKRKAFVGDGSSNNWALWEARFSSFTPILDIIHGISYVFAAAMAGRSFKEGWPIYLRWVTRVWQGEVERVIAELATRQAELGSAEASDGVTHPRAVVGATLGYLQNHKDKMRYAEYRRQGLPITSSYVESAVKQFNQRVKGTEKFWTKPGAEALLQLRADYLNPPEGMDAFWERRQKTATGQRPYTPRVNPRPLLPA